MRVLIQNYKLEPRTFLIFSITLFPVTLLIGSSFINSSIVLIDILFLFILIKEKKIKFLKKPKFLYFIISMGNLDNKYASQYKYRKFSFEINWFY